MAKLRFSKRLSIMVTEQTVDGLDELANTFGLNRSDVIRLALRAYVAGRQKEFSDAQENKTIA